MNLKLIVPALAALAGCTCCTPKACCDKTASACTKPAACTCPTPTADCKCAAPNSCIKCDPVVGNWGLELGYDAMKAGHMIASRDALGKPQALVLWRWASPVAMTNVKFDGNKFSFDHPWGFKVEGEVTCKDLTAKTIEKDGKPGISVKGWRNPPIAEGVSTKDAKFGAPIDLLKDGLNGWEPLEKSGKNGWSFKDGVLSNKLGLKADGSWAGGGLNLRTKRADFLDFNLEYDVRVPKNSNSGVYLRGRYEIQVVDSYGKPVNEHNMAAYYGRVVPKVAAEKPAGEWQHVNVTLYKRHLTVVLNGKTIIDNTPVVGVTGGAVDANEFVPGFIYLQGDHSDADFKNMILRPAL